MDIDYSDWIVSLDFRSAVHNQTGTVIEFRGDPESHHFQGYPSFANTQLTALQQVRLIRFGYEAYRTAYAAASPRSSSPTTMSPRAEKIRNDIPNIVVKKSRTSRESKQIVLS